MQSVALTPGATAIITADTTAIVDCGKYRFRYCVKWGETAMGNEALEFTIGGVTYPVLTKLGNPVYIGRLRRREVLCLVLSNVTSTTPAVVPHFTLCNPLHEMCCQVPSAAA